MKKEKINFDKIYWHDAILNSINIKNISKKGSKIYLFLDVYLDEKSENRIKIKIIFKKVKILTTSLNFIELFDNKSSGNLDIQYHTNTGYNFNFFGGLFYIETHNKPKVFMIL